MKSRPLIGISQSQRLSLNLGLTASLRVLHFDAAGLTRYLEEQAQDNPHLSLAPPSPGDWLPRWSEAFRQGAGGAVDGSGLAAGSPGPAPSLIAHVATEIARLTKPGRERDIALALAEGLEPSGWLGRPLADLARHAGASLPETEAVLARLHRIDPPGLFARSLAECLRLQAQDADCLDPVMDRILDHLDLLAAGDHARLARLCGVTEDGIAARLRLIRSFDPKPGARFDHGAAPVREPDLIARRGPGGWQVALNRSALPALVVHPADGANLTDQRPGWKAAQALDRMVEGRNATLLRVGRDILGRQQAALERGLTALVPLGMAEVAAALDLHESTVSRAVAGTSVDTPLGTWWLRDLFSVRIGAEGGPSAAALRAALARLVAVEPQSRPLSDAALVAALAAQGLPVARRTVAKYREMLHIPPAHRRRR
ncbi:RNA polymerase factor sigma-54 [Paracoccaceae bacterium Fryx2]|nr:RNA polymerase factor sigma-54 [Paracoccaceae bacterium Fryx2]